MRLLLDTHTIYWAVTNTSLLSNTVLNILKNPDNEFFVSYVSFYEFAIKFSIGKLDYKNGLNDLYYDIHLAEFKILVLKESHFLQYQTLPLHHRDPFDRLLIAQAKAGGLTLISKDEHFSKYDVEVIW